jgi:ribonuclease HII
MRWVGIDEAGYGPNLGPLVLTAVVAEGDDRRPDVWNDLAVTVCRAGGDPSRLWVDDSKRIYRAADGLQRLEAAGLAVLDAIGLPTPASIAGWFSACGAGSVEAVELRPWLGRIYPLLGPLARSRAALARRPLVGAPWRIVAVRSVVVGPSRFNRAMEASGSKAAVHYEGFAQLMRWIWDLAADGVETVVRSDKHGGRHYYFDLLRQTFPETWVDRGPEGAALSRYTVREPGRRLELSLVPRADADDGLVALASILSKLLRERWMAVFNAYWTAEVDGLAPTAGYPGDSARFRGAIEPLCRARGLDPSQWWRSK